MPDEITQLQEENRRLRDALSRHGIEPPSNPTPEQDAHPPTATLSNDQKVTLFRALFRGREDVYAVRWESPDGRSGYTPKSERDWKAYMPRSRRIASGSTGRPGNTLALTDDAIRTHLLGKIVLGVYPLLRDETCWFLAADFDKASWRRTVCFLQIMSRLAFPASLGTFDDPGVEVTSGSSLRHQFPATLARRLGCALLTRTMERRHQIGLDSYDRFFPNQDTMPKGGFGNLIALPLQKASRDQGNSVFLDERLEPFADQWVSCPPFGDSHTAKQNDRRERRS